MSGFNRNLIINIDVNNTNCIDGDINLKSLSKWRYAKSKDVILYDYGLTAFDFGFTNKMEKTIQFNSKELELKRVGSNIIDNPTKNDIRPYEANTSYDNYEITQESDHLDLNGGYYNGFFKLDGYNYEVIPTRFKDGFTIENLLHISENSEGLFFTIGCKSEDKYNLEFSGEKEVTTHNEKPLDSLKDSWEYNESFRRYETELKRDIKVQPENFNNIIDNILGFGITKNKKLYYQYVTEDGLKINESPRSFEMDGRTLISIVYKPQYNLKESELKCHERRKGVLYFFINGFIAWKIDDFIEPIFKKIENDSTKQIGVPYTISWGGGSFGLKHSYHYDSLIRFLYENQDNDYINNNFSADKPEINLEHNNTTFTIFNENIQDDEPLDVIKITNNGNIKKTLIKFDEPIKILANRPYLFNVQLYNEGFFKTFDEGNVLNKIKLVAINDYDIEILDEKEYMYPLISRGDTSQHQKTTPFVDGQEYMYVKDGVRYYGTTGVPILSMDALRYGFHDWFKERETLKDLYAFGENKWVDIHFKFKLKQNFNSSNVEIGILIESETDFNINKPLYLNNFIYDGADILVKDPSKNELFIERNFDKPFIGGLEKLRVYDKSLTLLDIRNVAKNETPPIKIIGGGRIIDSSGVFLTTTTTTTTTEEPQNPIYLGYLTLNQGNDLNPNIINGDTHPTQVIEIDRNKNHPEQPFKINAEWKNTFTGMYDFIDYTQFLAISKIELNEPYNFYQNLDFGWSGIYSNKGVIETHNINNVEYWVFKLNITAPINYMLY